MRWARWSFTEEYKRELLLVESQTLLGEPNLLKAQGTLPTKCELSSAEITAKQSIKNVEILEIKLQCSAEIEGNMEK